MPVISKEEADKLERKYDNQEALTLGQVCLVLHRKLRKLEKRVELLERLQSIRRVK